MKKLMITIAMSLLMMQPVQAAGTQYEMRVDGLACPFCAYGIEKKLKAIKGTSNIRVDLDNGLVKVDLVEGKDLEEGDMKKLFNDAGFTYRSMKKEAL